MKNKLASNPYKLLLLGLLALLFIASLYKAYYYTKAYGGGELKRRIVGARLLHTDKQPYHYNWSHGDDIRYFVSNSSQPQHLNGLSVTPSTLYLLKPLSYLSFDKIRLIWTLLQIIAFAATFYFVFSTEKITLKNSRSIFLVALLFFTSPTWFINIERGQIYIFYAAIFALMYYVNSRHTLVAQLLLGILLAYATWLRPFFAVVFIPILIAKRNITVISTLITGGILMIITLADWPIWQQYFKAMEMYITYNSSEAQWPTYIFKDIAEGISNYDIAKTDWQVSGITPLGYLLYIQYHIYMPMYVYYVFVLASCFATTWYFRSITNKHVMLIGFLCYMLFELIMPAQRGSYNLILWLFPMLVVFANNKQHKVVTFCAVLGFALIQGWPFFFPMHAVIGEMLLIAVLVHFLMKAKATNKMFYIE